MCGRIRRRFIAIRGFIAFLGAVAAAAFATTTQAGPPGECGDPKAGAVCGSACWPGCDDAACCDLICAAFPFCCEFEWNVICAEMAAMYCPHLGCGVPPCPPGSIDENETCIAIDQGQGCFFKSAKHSGRYLRTSTVTDSSTALTSASCWPTGRSNAE